MPRFCDLTSGRGHTAGMSSRTRGAVTGNPNTNIIDYVTISSTGDALDFGDIGSKASSSASNQTRVSWQVDLLHQHQM